MGLVKRDTASGPTPRGPYRTAASSRGRRRSHRDFEGLAILAAFLSVCAIPVSALATGALRDSVTNIGAALALLALIALVVQLVRGDRSGRSGPSGDET